MRYRNVSIFLKELRKTREPNQMKTITEDELKKSLNEIIREAAQDEEFFHREYRLQERYYYFRKRVEDTCGCS